MNETVTFQGPGLLVSTTRIFVYGTTYATRNITSARLASGEASATPVGLLLVGLIMLTQDDGWVFAVPMIGGALTWLYRQVSVNVVTLTTGAGEVVALRTRDTALAQQLVAAIGQAIAAR